MKERKQYCVEGIAKFDGSPRKIREKTFAISGAQAKLFVYWRLENREHKMVYLGDCDVYELPLMHKVSKEEQLRINFYKAP